MLWVFNTSSRDRNGLLRTTFCAGIAACAKVGNRNLAQDVPRLRAHVHVYCTSVHRFRTSLHRYRLVYRLPKVRKKSSEFSPRFSCSKSVSTSLRHFDLELPHETAGNCQKMKIGCQIMVKKLVPSLCVLSPFVTGQANVAERRADLDRGNQRVRR